MNLTIDTETELIGSGRKAPLMACMSVSTGQASDLLTPDQGCDLLERWIDLGEGWLIGHNIAFDLSVVLKHRPELSAKVWMLYDQGRVYDTGIHERLWCLYYGHSSHPSIGTPIISKGVSLAQLVRGLLDLEISEQKFDPNSPRYQYGSLIDTPIDQWSEEAKHYALEDARLTHRIFETQQARLKDMDHETEGERKYLASFPLQVRAAFALRHLEIWGMKASPESVREWKERIDLEKAQLSENLREYGLIDEKGKRLMSVIRSLIEQCHPDPPRTDSGLIQTSAEVLDEIDKPIIKDLSRWQKIQKLEGSFGPILENASAHPLNPRWNVLVRTGRTSCIKPNMQQLPQQGGVREAFAPREGKIYIGADYSTAELVALAQVCLNLGFRSRMADAIREGQDLHLSLAAELMGISYDQALDLKRSKDPQISKMRQLAKIPNFGLPGGLGVQNLVSFAKSSYGVSITEREAKDLKDAWFKKWPEMRLYFDHVKRQVEKGYLIQHFTGRRRGSIGFTDGANSYFQGLVADGAKSALYGVVRASWAEPRSPLFGAKPVLFVHDEIICEADEKRGPSAAEELGRLMLKHMGPFVPDLPMQVEAWCSRRWRKGIDEIRDDTGVLIIQE